MASIPDFFPEYRFSPDEFSVITSIMAGEDQSYVRTDSFSSTNMSRNDDSLDIFLGESEIMSPIPVANSLPERSGILDIDAPKLMDNKIGHKGGIAKIQNFDCGYREDFGEVMPIFTPVCPLSGEKWEDENDQTASTKNSKTKRVVRYTAEERKERIPRHLKKKNQRAYNKNVKVIEYIFVP
ncbi:hypothetical protein DKX38_001027 [Salix brachista]|uniref:CCT domain-containing protein n=1 Tax=Salix brachista TaxID=2182728 RepID=A0A5N5P4B8_9ROSI|nr:hypothetical protein DKX38_001027 [Salix brachista]